MKLKTFELSINSAVLGCLMRVFKQNQIKNRVTMVTLLVDTRLIMNTLLFLRLIKKTLVFFNKRGLQNLLCLIYLIKTSVLISNSKQDSSAVFMNCVQNLSVVRLIKAKQTKLN